MFIKSRPHRADPAYTVHLREAGPTANRPQDRYEIAVTKHGLPAHQVEHFTTRSAAEKRFRQLT